MATDSSNCEILHVSMTRGQGCFNVTTNFTLIVNNNEDTRGNLPFQLKNSNYQIVFWLPWQPNNWFMRLHLYTVPIYRNAWIS